MMQARNDRQKTFSPERESSLWSVYEEYMHGDHDLESLDRIEEECEDVSPVNTSSPGLMDTFLHFMGALFH
jgi:hypothetical protein